jgi:NAD(P)-dependent dehydrogenase (short-subunit alcohol dehydrogenase family)
MSGRMAGRVALVTGASSGIGRASALALAKAGASVALVALPGGLLEEAASACREAGVPVHAIAADVADSAAVAAAFDAAEAELGPVCAVFNNAGICQVVTMEAMTDAQFARQLNVNLAGAVFVAREAIRRMLPRGRGAIVNTASELSLIGETGYVGYSATKGGVLAMSRALAAEVAARGIRVNAVCPGATETPLLASEFLSAKDPAATRAAMARTIAMGRFGQPEEIAAAVVFLLSDEASYITGAYLPVDGGRTTCVVPGVAA